MVRSWMSALCCALIGCSAPPPPFPDMQAGEIGRVTKIIDGDGLVLDSGQSVRLISITAPVLSPRDRPPEPFSGESARILEDLALGRRVKLFYPGLTRDRYDRALAHVMTVDASGSPIWLNREMIARGAARVRLYGSTAALGQDLLALEAEARAEQRGLWALPDYQVQAADQLAPDRIGFLFISATLDEMTLPAEVPDERYPPACLLALREASLTVRVDRSAQSACGLTPGSEVELRGWVSNGELSLRHPWHLRLTSQP